jgi:tetratricopeptide (TPR) repeat protein
MSDRTTRHAWRNQLPYWLAAAALFLGCTMATVNEARDTDPSVAKAPHLLDELGDHGFAVTTSSPLAQRYFNQGLALTYGFNHAAAVSSFEEAARLDPSCASCFWAKGLALGPNINAPMGPDAGRAAHAAAQQAYALRHGVTPKERALIEALTTRYAEEPPEDRAALDLAYANAMRGVRAEFPEDTDVATLTAEALMDLYPWAYWTADAEPREHTLEIVALIEWVLEKQPDHLGANHYYIHAVEEYYPDKAEAAADRLVDLAPDAGHLVHMPSHIYWRIGRYNDASDVNQRAAKADEEYFAWCRPSGFYRALYYPHNVHFLWAAASAEGRSELALTAARKLAQQVEPLHAEFQMVEEFLTVPQLTLVRFGRWDAVLGVPKPAEGRVFQIGIWHYSRGVAFAKTGKLAEARAEYETVVAMSALAEAEAMVVAGGIANAGQLLSLGADHLAGEIARSGGEDAEAIAALESAVAKQDALAYMEPPPWYFPVRQALGAELLEQGRAAEAEAVYRKDLEQYPKNGWSFFGLGEALAAQDREAEATLARAYHAEAFREADVELEASAF